MVGTLPSTVTKLKANLMAHKATINMDSAKDPISIVVDQVYSTTGVLAEENMAIMVVHCVVPNFVEGPTISMVAHHVIPSSAE